MRNNLLLSAGGTSGELPLPVMTIIAVLLLMLPYLIYRYTGKSVTEWFRLSVLIDWINRLGASFRGAIFGKKAQQTEEKSGRSGHAKGQPPTVKKSGAGEGRNNVQTDYLRFISSLLNYARKNRLFTIIPGNIRYEGQNAQLTALLVTRTRVIGIMAYAFDGEIRCGSDGQWLVQEAGSSRKIGCLSGEVLQQEEILKGVMSRIGLGDVPAQAVMVFTGSGAVLPENKPDNAMTAESFYSKFLGQNDLQGDAINPKDTGKKLNLLREGKTDK